MIYPNLRCHKTDLEPSRSVVVVWHSVWNYDSFTTKSFTLKMLLSQEKPTLCDKKYIKSYVQKFVTKASNQSNQGKPLIHEEDVR